MYGPLVYVATYDESIVATVRDVLECITAKHGDMYTEKSTYNFNYPRGWTMSCKVHPAYYFLYHLNDLSKNCQSNRLLE